MTPLRLSGLRLRALVVTAASAAVTITVAVTPALHFAYRRPALHVALETAAALTALLASFLVLGRYRRSNGLPDLLLTAGLLAMAVTNLFFAALPTALEADDPRFDWAALTGRAFATVLLCAAAFAPARRIRRVRTAIAALAGAFGAAAIVAVASAGDLAVLVRSAGPLDASRPALVGHPAVLAMQLAMAALLGLAAWGFARRAERTGDQLLEWLAIAAIFGVFARVNYFLYPSLYTGWVCTGDVFRLCFHGTILFAVGREISQYWRTLAQVAVVEERRRIARNLHDGLAQELAYVRRNLRLLAGDSETLARVTGAADRALFESRQAVAALSQPVDEPFPVAISRAVGEIAERFGTKVDFMLPSDVDLTPEQREALTRIACEAVANAARHGKANAVSVRLTGGAGVRLRVTDHGEGFDPEAPTHGFGLVSMRDRARALGGRVDITSAPGSGASVEVTL